MKTNHCKLLQLSTLSVLTLLAFTTPAIAEKIYHWKDEAGKTYYTNNPALVPLDSNNTHIIKMKDIPTPPPVEEPIDGHALWDNNCTQCHHIEVESFKGMQGMPKLITEIKDSSSPLESSLDILQAAIKGEMDNNTKSLNKLTPDELKAIIAYITDQVTLTTPPTIEPAKK